MLSDEITTYITLDNRVQCQSITYLFTTQEHSADGGSLGNDVSQLRLHRRRKVGCECVLQRWCLEKVSYWSQKSSLQITSNTPRLHSPGSHRISVPFRLFRQVRLKSLVPRRFDGQPDGLADRSQWFKCLPTDTCQNHLTMYFLISTWLWLLLRVFLVSVLAAPSPKSFEASPSIQKSISAILKRCMGGGNANSIAGRFPPDAGSSDSVKIFTDIPVRLLLPFYLF